MNKIRSVTTVILLLTALLNATAQAQRQRTTSPNAPGIDSRLTGVYRLDLESSDRLYSVVSGASSNLPFGEQQRFFIDLTIRLTPPDQIAIERRGRRIDIASSRAPRITFDADAVTRTERAADGHTIRTRATLDGDQLMVSTSGGADDKFTVTFESVDNGRRLRVTRRIYAEELNQPVVIRSIYNKISDVAQWNIYGEPQTAPTTPSIIASTTFRASIPKAERDQAAILRTALDEWIAATNARDIKKQMTFYMPTLRAYYRTRHVPRETVRADKARVFEHANTIDIHADDPEIIFRETDHIAIMRFRKRYVIEGGPQSRRGEVVQELRWQQTSRGWKITSERDVRVIR